MSFRSLCLFSVSCALSGHSLAGDPPATNFLFILMDDLGLEQLSCYDPDPGIPGLTPGPNFYDGNYEYAPTPNISVLAKDGIRFTRCFTSQLCSPTRAQIQTGRYPHRTLIGANLEEAGKEGPFDLPHCEVILPEMLQASPLNPAMAYFGKWHLMRSPCLDVFGQPGTPQLAAGGDSHPVDMGWPFYRGIVSNPSDNPYPPGCPTYFNWYSVTCPAPATCAGDAGCTPSIGTSSDPCATPITPTPVCREIETNYITTTQRGYVQEWILERESEQPWFAFWSTTATHRFLDWPPGGDGSLHSYGRETAGKNTWLRIHPVLEALDAEIGILRRTLDKKPADGGPSIWERTVVVVMGDNGTERGVIRNGTQHHLDVNEPYLGVGIDARFKWSPYTTGTNVPLIISGPVVDEALKGTTNRAIVEAVDLFDTVRDFFGVADDSVVLTNPIDGRSILPLLQGDASYVERDESLAMMYSPNGCFPPVPPPGTMNPWDWQVQLGFTKRLAENGAITGGIYRLIRDVDTEEGDDIREFYRVADENDDAIDWLEAVPLDFSPGSPWREEYLEVCAAVNAKLSGDPGHCCEPCLDDPPGVFCICADCP